MQIYSDIRSCKFFYKYNIFTNVTLCNRRYQNTNIPYQNTNRPYQNINLVSLFMIIGILTIGILILTRAKTIVQMNLKISLKSVFPCPGFAHSNDLRPRHPNVSECTQLCLLTMSGRMSV